MNHSALLNWRDRVEPREDVDLPPGAPIGSEFVLDGVRWEIVGTTPAEPIGLRAFEAFVCTIGSVSVATERTSTSVPSDRLREVAERMTHLESARTTREKIDDAIETGTPLKLDPDEKRVVLDVLRHWMSEDVAGVDELGDELHDVFDKLRADLDKNSRT